MTSSFTWPFVSLAHVCSRIWVFWQKNQLQANVKTLIHVYLHPRFAYVHVVAGYPWYIERHSYQELDGPTYISFIHLVFHYIVIRGALTSIYNGRLIIRMQLVKSSRKVCKHRLFPKPVNSSVITTHLRSIPTTTCCWSSFIAGYPSSCMAVLLALSVSLSVRAIAVIVIVHYTFSLSHSTYNLGFSRNLIGLTP